MKFKKKDLNKIIEILTKKQEELKNINDDELIEYNSHFKIINFIIPAKFAIKAHTQNEAEIIYKFLEQHFDNSVSSSWRNINAATSHYLHINVDKYGTYNYACGSTSLDRTYKLLNSNDFLNYIVNK